MDPSYLGEPPLRDVSIICSRRFITDLSIPLAKVTRAMSPHLFAYKIPLPISIFSVAYAAM